MGKQRLGRFYITGPIRQLNPEWLQDFFKDFVLGEQFTPSEDGRYFDKAGYVGTHPLFVKIENGAMGDDIPTYSVSEAGVERLETDPHKPR